MRKKREMVELSFRIPADGWKDLAALLLALVGSGAPIARQRGGEGSLEQMLVERSEGENTGFDEAAFDRLFRQEQAGAVVQQEPLHYRAEGWVSGPLSAPKPAAFTGEQALEQQKYDGMNEEDREERKESVEQIDWEQRWERDCRRYDGGFTLS